MNAIRIRKQLTSHPLELPEVAPFEGKAVEILVIEESESVDQVPNSAVRFALDDGFDLDSINEAVVQSGALSRLA